MRANTITEKVPTQFAPLYVHVSHDDHGRITEISFSSPGKLGNSAVEDALVSLGIAATDVITTINEAFQPEEQTGNGEGQ